MDKQIKRFYLAAQAFIYTGLLSVALESGTASAEWQPAPQPAAPVVEQPVQQPDWLLPMSGITLLAISFGIEIYRHRCFLDSTTAENAAQVFSPAEPPEQLAEQPLAATEPKEIVKAKLTRPSTDQWSF